jgi:putative endonuclease
MFFVYVIYSTETDRYYTGQTEDLETRMKSHEAGISPFTSIAKDWKLVYFEEYKNRTDAIKREIAIKKKKSRKYIEWLISNKGD